MNDSDKPNPAKPNLSQAQSPPPESLASDSTPADSTPADSTPADSTPADSTPADLPPCDVSSRHHLRNLVIMAFADGSLGDREVNLVADRCVELGLNENDLHDAIAFGLSDDAQITVPDQDAAKKRLIADLIRMMAADGHLDESEKQLFAFVAAKLNLTRDQIDVIISQTVGTIHPSSEDLNQQ